MQHDLGLPLMLGRGSALPPPTSPRRGEVRQLWVPCGWDGVKADHLPPSHRRAAASALARSSGLRSARASSSMGSPLPAVFATRCHLRPSILSIGAPCPLTSTRARRFWAIGLFCLAALRNSATAAASFFGVPVPL